MTEKWKELAQKARDYRDVTMSKVEEYFPTSPDFVSNHLAPLPEELPTNVTGFPKKYLNEFDYTIIETDPIVLLKEIAEKKYSAVQVAAAYSRAAVLSQRLVNCVTEFLPDMAFEYAKFLDDYLEKNGKTIGPLHGLPVSLKDHIALEGRKNNFALTALVDNVTHHTSTIVTILKNAGAVFYQRTTQPQFLMFMECHSNVYGVTSNPFNTTLSCGGSSGGEAASLGMHSSSIGIGSDIGGSVRGPAAMQGAYGFKPTSNRLPCNDVFVPITGAESIAGAIGPMGRTLEITELIVEVITDAKPWKILRDMSSAPWEPEEVISELKAKKKIVIGVLSNDEVIEPQPPVKRALKEVTDKLKEVGAVDDIEFELKTFEPLDHKHAYDLIRSLFFEDGCEYELGLCAKVGEPLVPGAQLAVPENKFVKQLDISSLWSLNTQKWMYRAAYNKHWRDSGVDILLSPVLPGSAQPHMHNNYWGYTSQWNLLDYPAISFPATVVHSEKDTVDPDYKPGGEHGHYYKDYHPEKYVDAPVCLQIIAPRSEDELVLEGLKLIEKALKA